MRCMAGQPSDGPDSGHHAISMYKAPIISAPTFIHKSCCRSMWENSRDIQHAPIFVRGRLSARERRDEYLPIVGVALFFPAGNLHFLNGSIADRLQMHAARLDLKYIRHLSLNIDQHLICCDPIWIWHPTGLPYVSGPFRNICFLFYFGPCRITWSAVPPQAH